MYQHNSPETGNAGNFPIKSMFCELAQLDDMLGDPSVDMDNNAYETALQQHWALREQVCSTPARSPAELMFKACALKLEMERDEEFTNHGPGSARELAKSIADDVLRLMHTERYSK